MQFYIHKHVLGTEKHLRISDGEFSWSSTVPPDAWQFGDSGAIKSIDDLIKLYGRQVEGFDKIPEYIFFRDLGMLPGDVQWHSVLTKERYGDIMKTVINGAQSSLEFSRTDPYVNTFLKSRKALMMLEKAHINIDLLKEKLTHEVGTQHSNLQTFMPDTSGFAKPVAYNQFSTATGRLTISDGPQILTLSKGHRNIIDSRWGDDGVVMYVDFVSLEPRVALMRLGLEPGKDVYEFVNNECFDGQLSRAQAKISTLGALYGMSVRTFGNHSSSGKKKLNEVKKLFQVGILSAELSEEWDDIGKIMNMFGRQIVPNEGSSHILVNSWLQSSAVDVALVGFHNLITDVQTVTGAVPLFYIHDACVFDVPKIDIDKFSEIVNNGAEITGLGNFPLTCGELGHDD